jgi:hypothetical protein
MRAYLRKALIDSNVAAIAIAIMLFECIQQASLALWEPIRSIFSFLTAAMAVRIHFVSYIPQPPESITQQMFTNSAWDLVFALADVTGAWFLSLLIFGTGPFDSLGSYKSKFSRKSDA